MPERPQSASGTDRPSHLLDTGVPIRNLGGAAVTLTDPSGTVLLTVTLQAPPEGGDTEAVIVLATGAVDMYTAPLLEAALNDAVDRHATVRCDLSDVRLLGAAGITALLNAHERAVRAGSRLTVRGARGLTRHVLQITKVERLLCEPSSQVPAGVDQQSPRPPCKERG